MQDVQKILEDVLCCSADALCEPAPKRAIVAPGAAIAWDDCCDGQVWVRLIALVPRTDPRSIRGGNPCGVLLWEVTVAVGTLRCAHTLHDDGTPPTPEELLEDSRGMTRDMKDLMCAMEDCWPTVTGVEKVQPLRWDPGGPEGGCVGGEWTAMLLVSA